MTRPSPNLLIIRSAGLALAAAVSWGLGGCQSSFDRLDGEVADLIEQRQTLVLGQTTAAPPSEEADAGSAADPYLTHPATRNPAPDQLPAATDPDPLTLDPVQAMKQSADDAGNAQPMDLVQLLGYAIEHAPTYRNEKEGLYLTVLSLIAERHLWGPRFFDTVTARVTGTPEAGDHDAALDLVNELGVTQRLPSGGSIGVSALVDYVNYLQREVDSPGDVRDEASQSVEASIDLPLLRGAGRTAREDLIQADRNVVYAVRDFERFRREFLVDVANDYFDLIRLQRSLVNQRLQMQSLQLLADETQALAEAGEVAPFDAENTAQQVLFSYNNLINAQENYQAAVDAFKLRIGFPVSRDLRIEPMDLEIPTPKLDSATAVRTAWDLRLDLQTSSDRVDDARRQVDVARNRMLPDLDLFGQVSAASDPDHRHGGWPRLREGAYSAGATFSLPLDRRIEWTQVRRAQITLEQQKRSHQLFRDQIALQVRRSVRTIEQARTSLQLQDRNVYLAQRRIRGLDLREQETQPRDMIEAQEDLLEARNRLDSADADLRGSILQYLLDTGQMRVGSDGQWLAPASLSPPPPKANTPPPEVHTNTPQENIPPAPPTTPGP